MSTDTAGSDEAAIVARLIDIEDGDPVVFARECAAAARRLGVGVRTVQRAMRMKRKKQGAPEQERRRHQNGADNRPLIQVQPGELPALTRMTEAALLAAPELHVYQRGDMLVTSGLSAVQVLDGDKLTMPRIVRLTTAALRERAAAAAQYVRWNERAKRLLPCDPPIEVVATLAERSQWPFLVLQGLVGVPVLRRDGSVHDRPGYDASTGLLYQPNGLRIPEIPTKPTRGQAIVALGKLKAPFAMFPFKDDVSLAVALSLMITAVIRPSLDAAPMHAITATAAGSGKGKLINAAAMLATGFPAAAYSYSRDPVEFEKLLGAVMLAGDPIVALDNVVVPMESGKLCSILVEPMVASRVLGLSSAPRLPTSALITANGNNLQIVGDLTRRTVLATLDAQMERPELRAFSFDPVQVVAAQRGELVAAVFTLLRGHAVAGRPSTKAQPLGSFERWARIVRDALLWVGCADPTDSTETVRQIDSRRLAHLAVVTAWRDTQGSTKSDITTAAMKHLAEMKDMEGRRYHDGLFQALFGVAAGRSETIDTHRLGHWLAAHRDRVIDGLAITSTGTTGGVARWRLTDADIRRREQETAKTAADAGVEL